jgi:hypothetical protein
VYRSPTHARAMNASAGHSQLCFKKDFSRKNIPEKNQIRVPKTPTIIGGEVPTGMVKKTPAKHQNTRCSTLISLFFTNAVAADIMGTRIVFPDLYGSKAVRRIHNAALLGEPGKALHGLYPVLYHAS